MFFSHYVFSKGFFVGWITITFIWVFCSAGISVILPIVETAGFFKTLYREIVGDMTGKRKRRNVEVMDARSMSADATPGSVTPDKEIEARK